MGRGRNKDPIIITYDLRSPARRRLRKVVIAGIGVLIILGPSPLEALPAHNPICQITTSC